MSDSLFLHKPYPSIFEAFFTLLVMVSIRVESGELCQNAFYEMSCLRALNQFKLLH